MIKLDKTRRENAYAYYFIEDNHVYLCRKLTPRNIVEILIHEFVHQALYNHEGFLASAGWDNMDDPHDNLYIR